ncbi:hypothetical protein Tco_0782480 [Tanacetum coccineum]
MKILATSCCCLDGNGSKGNMAILKHKGRMFSNAIKWDIFCRDAEHQGVRQQNWKQGSHPKSDMAERRNAEQNHGSLLHSQILRSVNYGRPFSTARSFNTVRPSYTAHPKSTSISLINDKDFKDFDGGYVTFGRGAHGGRITGTGNGTADPQLTTADPDITTGSRRRRTKKEVSKALRDLKLLWVEANAGELSLVQLKRLDSCRFTKPLVQDGDAADVDEHLYRSMIGSLMYLTASRPDIMFAVCACARFQVSPKTSHLLAVKRIFRYLKGKPSLGLWYSKDSPLELVAYTDSDYAGATQDRKSTTGGCQFLGNRLISWQCKKQTVVATSTTEAEYVAAASCCGQVLWIQNQLLDYGYNFMDTVIYIDNTSTICIIENPVQHSKTKHIEIRHHFIRDCNAKKLIQMAKIDTQHNVADLLTKGFDAGRFQYLVSSIGMLNP